MKNLLERTKFTLFATHGSMINLMITIMPSLGIIEANSIRRMSNNDYANLFRRMGITRVTPRTEGVSTSALIKRVGEYLNSGNTENKQETEWKKKEEEKKKKEEEINQKENEKKVETKKTETENEKVETAEKKPLTKSKGRGKK